jgi:hypothetical protein
LISKTLVDVLLVICEFLANFLEEQLGIGIHGSNLLCDLV